MERKSWNIRMKSAAADGRSLTDNCNNEAKDSWGYSSHYHGDDLLEGFSWPPRSYTCSFCKREFKSAQALGGHMNVHRRDRARLRQSPPWDGQSSTISFNENPNPSPTFSSFICPSRVPSFSYKVPSLVNPSLSNLSSTPSAYSEEVKIPSGESSPFDPSTSKDRDSPNIMNAFRGCTQEDDCNFLKKGDMVMLDLEIGLRTGNVSEDLDLELRLGYS